MDRLTIPQYEIMMEAHDLETAVRMYWMHMQAFQNFRVQAMKKSGKNEKPVYRTFESFFDYEGLINQIKNKSITKKDRFSGVGELLRKEQKKING